MPERPCSLLGPSLGEAKPPRPSPTGGASACAFTTLREAFGWVPPRAERATGTAHDRPRIGTKRVPRASESIPRSRLARRGALRRRTAPRGGNPAYTCDASKLHHRDERAGLAPPRLQQGGHFSGRLGEISGGVLREQVQHPSAPCVRACSLARARVAALRAGLSHSASASELAATCSPGCRYVIFGTISH